MISGMAFLRRERFPQPLYRVDAPFCGGEKHVRARRAAHRLHWHCGDAAGTHTHTHTHACVGGCKPATHLDGIPPHR